MQRLSIVLKVQALAFFGYGVAWILIPEFLNDTILGWENIDNTWPRGIGVAFVGLAWVAYLVDRKLESRLDLVWPLALVPALYVVTFVSERIADTFPGSDAWWWTNLVVSLGFAIALVGTRVKAKDDVTFG